MRQRTLWVLVGLLLTVLSGRTKPAQADEGWFSALLVGKWRHIKTGEQYHFRSDGAYTFFTGSAQRRRGVLEYSGRWRTFNPDPAGPDTEPSEWGLKLHALRRVVRVGSQRRTWRTNRGRTLRYEFPGAPENPRQQIVINGKRFVREH